MCSKMAQLGKGNFLRVHPEHDTVVGPFIVLVCWDLKVIKNMIIKQAKEY